VSAQRAHYLGIPDVDIRVVIRGFGSMRDSGDKIDPGKKIPELECLRDPVATAAPTWKTPKLPLYRNVRETLSHRFAPSTILPRNIARLRLPCRGMPILAAILLAANAATAVGQAPGNEKANDVYWRHLAFGFVASVAAHETAHILTAYALGAHPHLGFDNARPTIFSGIDSHREPHKQFLFSASGLTIQALIDEMILDIPHHRGAAFERGILAGGIGTTLFYITIGRNGSVSDISFMAQTSSLSKTELSLIFGGVSAIHALRIAHDSSYSHFFIRPSASGAAIGYTF
jgi:hypothetical protein